MFLIPIDSVIGFSTAAPTAIAPPDCFNYGIIPINKSKNDCCFKDGLLNYTMSRSNKLSAAHHLPAVLNRRAQTAVETATDRWLPHELLKNLRLSELREQ